MAQSGFSRSWAEVNKIWNNRPDCSAYFDPTPSGTQPQGAPRIFAPRFRLVWGDHFLGKSLDVKWNLSTQGTPTTAAIQNARNGILRIGAAATSEAETNELNFNDILQFDPAGGLTMEFGYRFTTLPSTANRAVMGFGSARNNTYNSVATSAWLRLEATGDLLTESDDNASIDNSVDTGQDITANIWNHARIEFLGSSNILFFNGVGTPSRVNSGSTFATGTGLVQPIFGVQKDSGALTPTMELDYVFIFSRT